MIILHDSIRTTSGPGEYRVDLNRDGSDDVYIQATNTFWQTWQESFYYAKALHAGTKIHVVQGMQPMCEDLVLLGTLMVPHTHNCDGGPTQVRTDSFYYVPNLKFEELATTSVQTIAGDTMLIEKSHIANPMPAPIVVPFTSFVHGYFFSTESGYMLFSVNGKRFALLMRKKGLPYLYFDEIRQID